ncbi:MAG: glycosyl hydrolase 115 family protein [Breznakibacter sp.]
MPLRNYLYITYFLVSTLCLAQKAPPFVVPANGNRTLALANSEGVVSILADSTDHKGMWLALENLQHDIEMVTGLKPGIADRSQTKESIVLIVGTLGKSRLIDQLVHDGTIAYTDLAGKHEKFIIQTVDNPMHGIVQALVIAGSDMRGTIYGIYELSEQIGVSPWHYWADVPVKKSPSLYIQKGKYTAGEPAIKYRGIFLNDEAPALSGWAYHTFGGFNHLFYQKVFELILRLRGNCIWPAMWGNAFFDDDPANGPLANDMGIVAGTSHHEPMGRAHDEWRRYGSGKWDYGENPAKLHDFWQGGMQRMKNYETIVTIGMRGDGDEPMDEKSNIALLEKIIEDQRKTITQTTGRKVSETPQVWALYKEVLDYYDKGMRVPDDVTLLFCDDNWGNVRRLPHPTAKPRKGGYGMYYHFDYVGGPRNYKWINVTQVQRLWEQMNLAYSHGVDRIWIVNVGDLKPMEYPVSFFLDMAWNPLQFNADNLTGHTKNWCAQQFGQIYADESARLINLYSKYNRRVTPELLDERTYNLENYNEFATVANDYRNLLVDAMRLYNFIPSTHKDAFDQLVLFPINACSNLYEMYHAVAMNRKLALQRDPEANRWADEAKRCFMYDSLLTVHYNQHITNGKWAHMMDQVRIGYTHWQQPEKSVMPHVERVDAPIHGPGRVFTEDNGYVSIEAQHYNRAKGTASINWQVIPDLGKTLSGITTMPPNQYPAATDTVYLEYDIRFSTTGPVKIYALISPTLNFNANKGLRYAMSVDGGAEQIVNIHSQCTVKEIENWQANSINSTSTLHHIQTSGIYTIRFRVLEPGIVLQKLVIDTGGLKPSYLGPPESKHELNDKYQ